MSSNAEVIVSCESCISYIPHVTSRGMGYCNNTDSLVIPGEGVCDDYKKRDIQWLHKIFGEQGWLYCHTCRIHIFSLEELEKHINDLVTYGVFFDDAVYEDAYSAD